MAVKEKKPNNPLLARIGTNTPKQKNISTKSKASSKNNNPLAAALEKGRLSTQTLSDRITSGIQSFIVKRNEDYIAKGSR